jgi:hypothetical protein
MLYQTDDGTEEEWIWNSRDGVTPFVIMNRSGTEEMTHKQWQRDKFLPFHVPAIGDRIFIDLIEEEAERIATARIESMKDRFPNPPPVKALAKNILEEYGEKDAPPGVRPIRGPHLIAATKEYHEFFKRRRDLFNGVSPNPFEGFEGKG